MTTATALRTIARTTDEALAPLLGKIAVLEARREHMLDAADKADARGSRRGDALREQAAAMAPELAKLRDEAHPLRTIARAGDWARFIYVPNGHVHRFDGCPTLYPTTTRLWLPEYSGADEAELVEAAADAACTVCFPSAPVDRRSTVAAVVAEREAREAEQAEREAKRAKAAAGAIVDEDGRAVFKSQRAAENELGQLIGTAAYYAVWHAEVGAPHLGIPMKPNDESEAEHAARQAPKVAAELAAARRIVELLEANGIATEAIVAKKLAAKIKENTKGGGILPDGFGL